MPNPQLVDYITQQTRAGVAKEVVTTTLLATGWGERDVTDAMNAAMGTSPAGTQPAIASSPAVSRPIVAAKTDVAPVVMPAAQPVAASPAGASSPVSVNMFDAKSGPVFEPKSKTVSSAVSSTPSATSRGSVAAAAAPRSRSRFMPIILPVILGIVAVACGVLAYMMWSDNDGLRMQISALTTQQATLQAQVQGLQKDKDAAAAKIVALTESAKDFEGQLSLYVAAGGTSAAALVTVKGTLNGSDKIPYTLITSKGIVLNIKNYKDPSAFVALTPSLGKIVEITGTHTPGARDITITALNGTSLLPIASSTTP